jgi:hypothetical protein
VEVVREVQKLSWETGIEMNALYKLMVMEVEMDAAEMAGTVADNIAILKDHGKAEEDYLCLQRRPKDIEWLFHTLWRTRDMWQRLADHETDPEKRKLILAELAEHDELERLLFAKLEVVVEKRENGQAN